MTASVPDAVSVVHPIRGMPGASVAVTIGWPTRRPDERAGDNRNGRGAAQPGARDVTAIPVGAGAVGTAGDRRRFLAPLALAQFICSFAGSNMNVMINDITHDLDTSVEGVQATI